MLASKYGPPDVIRMDVEGHEVEIINGMLDKIRDGTLSPTLIFEVHRDRYSSEHNFEQVLRAMFECGYRVSLLGSSQKSGTRKLESLGYRGGEEINTDFMHRVVFENIAAEDAIQIICRQGGARTVVLSQ